MPDAEVIRIDSRAKTNGAEVTRVPGRMRCAATTSSGRPCRNFATEGSSYCRVHETQVVGRSSHPSAAGAPELPAPRDEEQDPVEAFRQFVRRRLAGDYPIDDFGYDRELSRQILLPLAKPLYENYFRVRTLGMTRIPNTGPALLVGNHSGTVAIDALMMQ
jgi:hypothetical protein